MTKSKEETRRGSGNGMRRSGNGMRATTVRFGADLWEALELEAARTGVSVAQYVREAALARVAHVAGLRGEPQPLGSNGEPSARGRVEMQRVATELFEASEATRAQSEQAVRHARAGAKRRNEERAAKRP